MHKAQVTTIFPNYLVEGKESSNRDDPVQIWKFSLF